MSLHDFADRRDQLYGYLESGLLRHELAILTIRERSEQIFLAMLRVHQLEYAKTHQDVSNNVNELIIFFEQCALAEKSSGKLAAIEK